MTETNETADKLLWGRTEEAAKLMEAYRSVKREEATTTTTTTTTRPKLVVVSGCAGVGKTALIERTLEDPLVEDQGVILPWRFDRQTCLQIGVGFREAFESLVHEKNSFLRERVEKRLSPKAATIVVSMLSFLEPLLENLLLTDVEPGRFHMSGLQFQAVRDLIQALACPEHPLVLLLDDCQWADPNSLHWATAIVADVTNRGILFVATHNNEISSDWDQSLRSIQKEVDIIHIELNNLDPQSDMARGEPALYDQTRGNPRFLEELLLHGSAECTSLAELLEMKLRRLQKPVQEVLMVSACLGRRINKRLISRIMSSNDIPAVLEIARQHGVLERHDDAYNFANNSMQEAAYDLVGHKARFHLQIGRELIAGLSDEELEWNLLTTLSQFVFAGVDAMEEREKYRVAALCLRGAHLAVNYGSFDSASRCVMFGIELLDRGCWRDEYDLALALHNAAAEVAMARGRFGLVEDLVSPVLHNARCLDDSLQAHSTRLYMWSSNDRMGQALRVGMALLRRLGVAFPRHPTQAHLWVEYHRTRSVLRGKTDESLMRQPTMRDASKLAIMKLMSVVSSPAYLIQPLLAPLMALKMVRLSMKHGFCAITSGAFSMYGMLLCSFAYNVQEGVRFGRLALRLLDRFQAREWIPRVFTAVYGFIFGWGGPLRESLEPLLRGYRVGLESGDMEFCLLSISLYSHIGFNAGKKLSVLENERMAFMQEMKIFHGSFKIRLHRPLSFTIRQLMGDATLEEPSEEERDAYHGTYGQSWIYFQKMMLAYLFGDFEAAVRYGKRCKTRLPFESVDIALVYMFDGLSNVALHRGLVARMRLRRLNKLALVAPDYCLGKYHLLRAELSTRNEIRHYKYAIALACNLLDEALAHELLGWHYHRRNQHALAKRHLHEACSRYRGLEAHRKADMLQANLEEQFLQE